MDDVCVTGDERLVAAALAPDRSPVLTCGCPRPAPHLVPDPTTGAHLQLCAPHRAAHARGEHVTVTAKGPASRS